MNGNFQRRLCALPYPEAKRIVVQLFNEMYTRDLLARCGGNVADAARNAGLDRSNFRRIMRKAPKKRAASAKAAPKKTAAGNGTVRKPTTKKTVAKKLSANVRTSKSAATKSANSRKPVAKTRKSK